MISLIDVIYAFVGKSLRATFQSRLRWSREISNLFVFPRKRFRSEILNSFPRFFFTSAAKMNEVEKFSIRAKNKSELLVPILNFPSFGLILVLGLLSINRFYVSSKVGNLAVKANSSKIVRKDGCCS